MCQIFPIHSKTHLWANACNTKCKPEVDIKISRVCNNTTAVTVHQLGHDILAPSPLLPDGDCSLIATPKITITPLFPSLQQSRAKSPKMTTTSSGMKCYRGQRSMHTKAGSFLWEGLTNNNKGRRSYVWTTRWVRVDFLRSQKSRQLKKRRT